MWGLTWGLTWGVRWGLTWGAIWGLEILKWLIIKEIRRKTGGLGRRLIISNSQLAINNSQLGFLSIITSSLNTGH